MDDQILVRAVRSMISAGTEMLVYRGETAASDFLPPMSRGTFPFPVKYGYQCVGVVEEAGPSTSYRPGDRVFVAHPHQDFFTMPATADMVTPIPDDVSDGSAIYMNLLRVAIDALQAIPMPVGDVVVVFGQGVVGTCCARLARRTASKLIVVDPKPQRRSAALEHGADAAVAPEDLHPVVAELSEGRGADVSIEASGAPSALQLALQVAAVEGDILAVSYFGTRPVQLQLAPEFHYRRIRIVSSQGGDQRRWDRPRRSKLSMRLLPELELDRLATRLVPFSAASEAYRYVDSEDGSCLGTVLDYGSESYQQFTDGAGGRGQGGTRRSAASGTTPSPGAEDVCGKGSQ